MSEAQKVLIIGGGGMTAQMTAALIAACKAESIMVEELTPGRARPTQEPDFSCLNRNLIPQYEIEDTDYFDRVPVNAYQRRVFKKWRKHEHACELWLDTAHQLDRAKTKQERRHIVKGYKNQRRILRLQHAGAQLTRIHECTMQ